MGNVVRFNRALRRQHAAQRRLEDRRQAPHRCAVEKGRQEAGVQHEVALAYPFFHDLHRVLGERMCSLCPRCSYLRGEGKIDPAPDRERTLERWRAVLFDAGGCC
jgi:hypothetical protein